MCRGKPFKKVEAEQKKFSIIDGRRFAKAATGAEYKRFFFQYNTALTY